MPNILSFEEFRRRDYFPGTNFPRYQNFIAHFGQGMLGEVYRETLHYKRFAAEHFALAALLCQKVQKVGQERIMSEDAIPLEPELYNAYVIMRGYGVSDGELFS